MHHYTTYVICFFKYFQRKNSQTRFFLNTIFTIICVVFITTHTYTHKQINKRKKEICCRFAAFALRVNTRYDLRLFRVVKKDESPLKEDGFLRHLFQYIYTTPSLLAPCLSRSRGTPLVYITGSTYSLSSSLFRGPCQYSESPKGG